MEPVRQTGTGEAGFYLVGAGGWLYLICPDLAVEPIISAARMAICYL